MGVLKFKLFGFPVQVHPLFWLVAFLLFSGARASFVTHLFYAGIIFLSIVTHELGHAIAARSAGQDPEISIHAFGGLTRWVPSRPLSRWRLIGITLAGPAAGLALAAAGFIALRYYPAVSARSDSGATLRTFFGIVFQVNLVWSLVNLLPVLPFDGGQIMAHALGPTRRQLSATLSAIFGVLIAIAFWYKFKWPFAAIMFGISGIMEYRAMQQARRATLSITPEQIERAITEARRALDNGDAGRALQLVQMVGALPATPEQQRVAVEVGAWAALALGDHAEARHALRVLSPGQVDPLLQAAVLEAHGDYERAAACLGHARESGDARSQVSASLVRVLLKDRRFGEAAAVTQQILDEVPAEDARRVALEAIQAGPSEPSARLALALFERTRDPSDAVAAARAFLSLNDRESAALAVEKAVAAGQSVTELDEVLAALRQVSLPSKPNA